MSRLADHEWLLKYTRDEGDLVALFYQIALTCAVRYDRLTGYFNAGALTLAARGIERLVRNGGRMRLVVGCTLPVEEVAAIEKGESLRNVIERCMLANPLAPSNQESSRMSAATQSRSRADPVGMAGQLGKLPRVHLVARAGAYR